MTDRRPTDDNVTLRDLLHVELTAVRAEVSSVRKDIDTLNTTIKDTAVAHAAAHDRDHKQTQIATDKAETTLTLRLDQIKTETGRVDDERKRQIKEVADAVTAQSTQWANLYGRMAGFGMLIAVLTVISIVIGLWAKTS